MSIAPDSNNLPDSRVVDLARVSRVALIGLLEEYVLQPHAEIPMDGSHLVLPRVALELLSNILSEMARGNLVAVMPVHANLTTQEAANLLSVSRPHLVKLLEDGLIPFSKVGTHRRIRSQDVLEYRASLAAEGETVLQMLADQAQKYGMGY